MNSTVQPTATNHFHLPSVHKRHQDGTGYDYEEDLYLRPKRPGSRVVDVHRVVRIALTQGDQPIATYETRDVLCREEKRALEQVMPLLMTEGDPEAEELMQERALAEYFRQRRILAGVEARCANCGCSESRACSGGCLWARPNLCSRCI